MTDKQPDLIQEARALLKKTAPTGKILTGADAYLFDMRGPSLMSSLADEIEQLRSQLKTQAENIAELQREIRDARVLIQTCRCGLSDVLRSSVTPKGQS